MDANFDALIRSQLRVEHARAAVLDALRGLTSEERRSVLVAVAAADLAASVPPTVPVPSESSPAPADSKTERILGALREIPGMPIRDLAVRVYGEVTKATESNTRSLLAALARKAPPAVRRVSKGRWVAVE
ncbi:MAG: hypothetical protein IT373_36310 [Polyangiaceae bacterium]|nr:hypothetical protein [Polyangiaceae bacterium]